MARLLIVLVLLVALASRAIASAPPTFCKCTCFKNSTIIPLGPGHEPPPAAPAPTPGDGKSDKETTTTATTTSPSASARSHLMGKRAASSSCSQCNRAFCLKYNLPICKGAEEKDVVTMCFARDSRKDRLIVWTFLLGTAGLLGWAGARRALEQRELRKMTAGAGAGAGMGAARGGDGDVGGAAPAQGRGDYLYVAGDDRGEGPASGLHPGR